MARVYGRWAKESRDCGATGELGLLTRISKLFVIQKKRIKGACVYPLRRNDLQLAKCS